MTRYNTGPQLLTPPREEEEIYPYRRVWPSLIIEVLILFGVALVFSVLGFIGIGVPAVVRPPVELGVIFAPVILWLIFSRLPENRASEPRIHMTRVFIIGALVANAVAIPAMNYLQVSQWLSGAETVDRWIGYTVTLGVLHEILKYIIVRYSIWPDAIRTRLDVVAYSAACAVGYTTVLNLHLIYDGSVSTDVIAVRVFSNVTIQLIAGSIVAYGLAEVRFNRKTLLLMPFTLLFAAFIHGLLTPTRTGLTSTGFVLGTASTSPLFSLIFSFVAVAGGIVVMVFVFNAAERRATLAGDE